MCVVLLTPFIMASKNYEESCDPPDGRIHDSKIHKFKMLHFLIDDMLDDAVNNAKNNSGSIVDKSIQNPTDLKNMENS